MSMKSLELKFFAANSTLLQSFFLAINETLSSAYWYFKNSTVISDFSKKPLNFVEYEIDFMVSPISLNVKV